MADIPWPTEFTPLFDGVAPGTHPRDVAYLSITQGDYGHREGFRQAAKHLIQLARASERRCDMLVLPALFDFRHFVEVALKRIIADSRIALNIAGNPPYGHNIKDLWKEAHGYLAQLDPVPDAAESVVERQIEEIARVDPFATAFRYPQDRDGNPSLPEHELIALDAVERVIDSVGTFLDCCVMVASQAREQAEELARYEGTA